MQAAEKIETAKITVLLMGSTIPDWLLAADPQVAGAPKGAWRFDCDVSIIEIQDDFLVFPVLPYDRPVSVQVLDFTGMANHFVHAPTKPVRVIHQVMHFFPAEYRNAVDASRQRFAANLTAPAFGGPVTPEPVVPLTLAEQVRPRRSLSSGLRIGAVTSGAFAAGAILAAFAAHFL